MGRGNTKAHYSTSNVFYRCRYVMYGLRFRYFGVFWCSDICCENDSYVQLHACPRHRDILRLRLGSASRILTRFSLLFLSLTTSSQLAAGGASVASARHGAGSPGGEAAAARLQRRSVHGLLSARFSRLLSHLLTHPTVSVSARDTSCLVWSPFE